MADEPTSPTTSGVAVSLVLTQRLTATGVTTFASVSGQRYVVDAAGKPSKVGPVSNRQFPDVVAAEGADADLAAAMATIQAAVQTYVTAAKLV